MFRENATVAKPARISIYATLAFITSSIFIIRLPFDSRKRNDGEVRRRVARAHRSNF